MIVSFGIGIPTRFANAQVGLWVRSVATSAGLTHHQTLDSSGETLASDYHRTETLRVTVQNMQSGPAEFLVEWMFLAKDLATKRNFIYSRGVAPVALTSGSVTNFEVRSQPLGASETQQYEFDEDDNGNPIMYAIGNRVKLGAKPAGYVFLVKSLGKLIAVEASDRDLKAPYQKELNTNNQHP